MQRLMYQATGITHITVVIIYHYHTNVAVILFLFSYNDQISL